MPDPPAGEVLVSAGGGAAGQNLLAAALAARRQGCLAERGWRLLAGTNLSDDAFAALRRTRPPGSSIERFRADFPALLRRCHVSVSQAGYNTVLDIVAARASAVLVPFAAERETEQLIRAEHLAARGAAELVRETELTPATLAAAIERAAARDPAPIASRYRRRAPLGRADRRTDRQMIGARGFCARDDGGMIAAMTYLPHVAVTTSRRMARSGRRAGSLGGSRACRAAVVARRRCGRADARSSTACWRWPATRRWRWR